jgi:hypothetical protein
MVQLTNSSSDASGSRPFPLSFWVLPNAKARPRFLFSAPFWLLKAMLDEENIRIASRSILSDMPLHKLALDGFGSLGVASEDYLMHLLKEFLSNFGL